jgi:hypothetical protein
MALLARRLSDAPLAVSDFHLLMLRLANSNEYSRAILLGRASQMVGCLAEMIDTAHESGLR